LEIQEAFKLICSEALKAFDDYTGNLILLGFAAG
jgi:hypothetical protein